MTRSLLIRVATGASVAALATAGAAVASGHSGGGPGPGAPPPGLAHHRGPGPELAAAATYLGISGDTLRSDLQSGKTLAQIADATSGKSASGLIDALVAADTTRITALVNGKLPPRP